MRFNYFLFIILFTISIRCFAFEGIQDTIKPDPVFIAKSDDWSLIEGYNALDSIEIGSKITSIYYIPCSHALSAELILVENRSNSLKIFLLPDNEIGICPDDESHNGTGIIHKQVNGKGLPEVIINWNFTICGATGVLCSYFSGIEIIDIQNEMCLLNIMTGRGEENNSGRYDGSISSFGCEKIVNVKNKEIILDKMKYSGNEVWSGESGRDSIIAMDEADVRKEFVSLGEDIDKEFSPNEGRYKWIDNVFIRQKKR